MIAPLRNGILFVFMDKTVGSEGKFGAFTEWGFNLGVNTDDTTKSGRWGRVLAVGPEATEVKEDMFIFIEPLMWTKGFSHNASKVWKTDESKVMLISIDPPK